MEGCAIPFPRGDQSRCATGKESSRAHDSPALAPNYTPVGEVLFTFAHHFGEYFRYLGFRDVKMASGEARPEPRRQRDQPESIIAADASQSRRSVALKERTESMPPHKRRAIWPAASLPARPMQRPPCIPNLHLCASMRGCAGNSPHPWESTVFRCSLPVLWLLPSRNPPAQRGSANGKRGLARSRRS